MSRWWVIVNPAAGREQDLTDHVAAVLGDRRIESVVRTSPTAEAVGSIVAEGRDRGFADFAAVGGDGTANLVVNALLGFPWPNPPTLAILPAGTGSDFIRTFAIPGRIEAAADHLLDERRYAVDVGLLTGSFGRTHFLNAANAGIAARTVLEANRLPPRLGSRRYLIGFWSALARTRPGDVRVRIDDRALSATAWNVVIANGQYFGGGMNVAPRAGTGDGRFDVQVFSGSRAEAPGILRRVIRGTHLTHRAVRRTTGRRIEVDVPATWQIEADGEIVGAGSFTADVLPGRLMFKI